MTFVNKYLEFTPKKKGQLLGDKLPASSGNRWYSIPVLASHSNCTVCIFIPFFRTLSRDGFDPSGAGAAGVTLEAAEAATEAAFKSGYGYKLGEGKILFVGLGLLKEGVHKSRGHNFRVFLQIFSGSI